MTANQNWVLKLVVGAKDSASLTLRRITGTLSGIGKGWAKLNGALRMPGVSRALAGVRDLTNGVARTFISAGRNAALFGSIAGAALGALLQRTSSAGVRTLKLAKDLGVGAEKFQEWRFAAREALVPAETFDAIMSKFGTRMSDARAGMGEARGALTTLGIQLNNTKGEARSLTEVFPEIANALAKIPAATRGSFVKGLFGEEGLVLSSMFADGAAGIEAAAKAARAAGAISSEEQLQGFADVQSSLRGIGTEFSGITTQLTASLLPTIKEVSGAFKTWLVDNQDHIKWWAEYLQTNVPLALGVLWDATKEFWSWLEPKVKWLGGYLSDAAGNLAAFARAMGWAENENTDSKARASRRRSMNARVMNGRTTYDLEDEYIRGSNGVREVVQSLPPAAEISGGLRVSFDNMPRGARVTRDDAARRWTSLDVGYAMPDIGGAFR